MAMIDTGALRSYLLDYYGTASFNGFPAAIMDVWDIEQASGEELCCEAERLGIDLRRFVVKK